ncbi:VanZ family protein [Sulfidibacter corallicola]|uniref:VanZ family protein n=1 Tax=Sulfidibacter corallicola TaxID=2818388 RepID=A0A8A4TMP1_SULCO|nr:VanZ family protein [Sulfidibacter corallicola]QTD51249.1 VanZ family protein [Sulfidibacter corallicola]
MHTFLKRYVAKWILSVFRYRWMASIILLGLIDFISYQAFTLGGVMLPVRFQDKILHCGAFMVLYILGHLSLNFDFFPGIKGFSFRILALNWMVWLSYGFMIEAVQSLLNHRSASVGDFIADVCGIALGCTAVLAMNIYPPTQEAGTYEERL